VLALLSEHEVPILRICVGCIVLAIDIVRAELRRLSSTLAATASVGRKIAWLGPSDRS